MTHFDSPGRTMRLALAMLALGAALAGCTKVDDTLGSNLIPEDQRFEAGYLALPGASEGSNPRRYVETRLYRTDSIRSSNLSYGYMGSELNDTLGLRTMGFLTQYLNYLTVEPGYFGYRPFVDSVELLLAVKSYGRDTLTPQRYQVFEVVDNSYLTEKGDTTFYLNFDPQKQGIVSGEPLFSFTFPDGETTGPATPAVRLTTEAGGERFLRRLLLQEGAYKEDYSIYSADSLAQWVEEFKGFYIRPADDQQTMGKGTIYGTQLEASGLAVYGRNRVKDDPSLIRDTIRMAYFFYDSYAAGNYGRVSVNTMIRRDYTLATSPLRIDPDAVDERSTTRPTVEKAIVEGMGGVVTEMRFTQAFFDALDAAIAAANTDGKRFSTLAFNRARMMVYFTDSDYDWQQIDPAVPGRLIDEMDAAQTRLGLYTDYKRLLSIPDYAYAYEYTYDTKLAYDGTIDRSRGCYVMDITGYMQRLWNSYLAEREAAEAEGRAVELERVKDRTIYLAPEAYGLYTPSFTVAQGMVSDANNAPIRFELTYNMIK